ERVSRGGARRQRAGPGTGGAENEPETYRIDWAAVHGGLNPWKRTEKVVVDPFLVDKDVKAAMGQCPHQIAHAKPLVWNEYKVFLDLGDWERIKKLESTLLRDMGEVVEKHLKKLKAEMVGGLTVRMLRDEGGTVRPGNAVIKVDFSEVDSGTATDPSEMTVRIGGPVAKALTDLTQRVPESFVGAHVNHAAAEGLQVPCRRRVG